MSMTITLGWWLLPTFLTSVMLFMVFRPIHGGGPFDLTPMIRSLWLIPILFVWVVYLSVNLWCQS